jgi:hypothetical protein
MLARIEAQRAHFASDDHIRERAAPWRDATPETCLAATFAECETADYLMSLKPAEERAAVVQSVPIPPDTIAILEALQRRR